LVKDEDEEFNVDKSPKQRKEFILKFSPFDELKGTICREVKD
jgi:hypothetical protein